MYKTNFYMIIRRLLFLLFIVAVHIPAEAQVKNINITVRKAEDLKSKDVAPCAQEEYRQDVDNPN